MKTYTCRCGACGHVGLNSEFPTRWDEEQQRNYASCSKCGEDMKVEGLINGRGATTSTIPPVSVAMDQLMKQMPGGWFFPRKNAWHNATTLEKNDPYLKRLTEMWTQIRAANPDFFKDREDDQCQDPPTQ